MDAAALVRECIEASRAATPRRAVADMMRRAVASSGEPCAGLPVDGPATIVLHASAGLTVIHLVYGAGASVAPHDHRMWAAIAVYRGHETHTLYRRNGSTLMPSGRADLGPGDVLLLGAHAVHSVANTRAHPSAAIHVYGGNLAVQARSEWDAAMLTERPFSGPGTTTRREASSAPAVVP